MNANMTETQKMFLKKGVKVSDIHLFVGFKLWKSVLQH